LGLGLVLCAIALTLTAFITVVVLRAHTAHVSPVLQEAWGQLLDPAGNPVICIATPVQLPLIQRPEASPNHPTVNSPDLLGWYNGLGRLPAAREIYLGTSTTSPFWGDMAGAFAIAEVLSRAGVNPEILPEAAIELPALRKRNVFLFGRPGYSPTIDRCLQDKPFGIPIPDKERSTVILNAKPKPGEQSEYDPAAESRAQRRETTFGLITVMPSGEGSYFRTVVLSGTLSPGAQAASEFFSSPAELENLKRMFIKEGFKTFPQSYQVIVRSTVFGASALDLQYVTHRAVSGR
jgi:hypothetical protein